MAILGLVNLVTEGEGGGEGGGGRGCVREVVLRWRDRTDGMIGGILYDRDDCQ